MTLADLNSAVADAGGKPIVLNLYCCQGGSAAGYGRAGFYVIGVDILAQPLYPHTFIQGDALKFLETYAEWIRAHVALVDASPPCQLYSRTWQIQGRDHPDLIRVTRELIPAGVPYVIENVEGAREHLQAPVTLCGAMFGMRTYRHRLFEAGNGLVISAPQHPAHLAPLAKMGRPAREGEFVQYVGNFSGVQDARRDMGMPWANRDGIREAVPPAYTEHIGKQIAAAVQSKGR